VPPRLWAWIAVAEQIAAGSSTAPNLRDLNLSSAIAQSLSGPRDFRLAGAPVVAVTATSDASGENPHRVRLNSTYVTALESAGLIPMVIPPLTSEDSARTILSRVDGLLLTGGEDVEPSLYGQPRSAKCGIANLARDHTEIALIRAAHEMRKPILAICRGPQVLNAALGGTLIQDIRDEVPGALDHNVRGNRSLRVHDVNIDEGSVIARAIGTTSISVNSLHHQSVLDVAPGLQVTARAPDGVVEGVESAVDDWWVIGVQWHPEEMNDSLEPWDRGIFRAFAERLAEG
jgi:putative glutamine amidotransferase